MTDETLTGDSAGYIETFGTPTPLPTTPDKPLDLDELMSEARLVERTARICIRGDLYGQWTDVVSQMAELVDADGNLLTEGDEALSDQSKVEALAEQERDLKAQMQKWMRSVLFRAMPSDEWVTFTKEHFGPDDQPKDQEDFHRRLIARCAVTPTLDLAGVDKMRTKIGPQQFVALANTAFYACTIGGLDIPKSPAFSRTQTQRGRVRN